MVSFWVIGGEEADAGLREAVGGGEQWIGPFRDYGSAREEWAKHAWRSADSGAGRYRIEGIDPDEAPPCTD